MGDDNADWFSAADDDPPPPEPISLLKRASLAAEAAAAPAAAAAAAEADKPAEDRPVAEDEFLDPDKLMLFKHWIRPKFLPYKYLYDYRHNYYDDVIDYLDKRQKGFERDVPRAQTWAERVLRTYNCNRNRMEEYRKQAEDIKLVTKMQLSGSFYRYHTKEYINRRYSSLLY